MMSRSGVTMWACFAWLVGFSAVHAQPTDREAEVSGSEPAEYRALIDAALEEYHGHNFPEARALFGRAHAASPSARTLRGLGMTEFELRNYRDSAMNLEAALASPVRRLEGELRKDTEELLARVRAFVARIRLETVPAVPLGLRLLVDGELASPNPDQTFTVAVGEHALVVQATGFHEEHRALSVKGAEEERVVVYLRPQAAAAPEAALRSTPSEKETRPIWKNPWLWTGVGAVVVGAVVAGVLVATRGGPKTADPVEGDIGGTVRALRGSR